MFDCQERWNNSVCIQYNTLLALFFITAITFCVRVHIPYIISYLQFSDCVNPVLIYNWQFFKIISMISKLQIVCMWRIVMKAGAGILLQHKIKLVTVTSTFYTTLIWIKLISQFSSQGQINYFFFNHTPWGL